MAVHEYVDGLCYTVKLPCAELSNLAESYQKVLDKFLESKVSGEKLHLGLKYLGYEEDYNDEYFEFLSARIGEIVKRHLPVKVRVVGLGGFWDSSDWPSKPIIFLKVELSGSLKALHEDLVRSLDGKVDLFILAEGENYTPHVTIGVGKEEFGKDLKEFVDKSILESSIELELDRVQIRMSKGRVLEL